MNHSRGWIDPMEGRSRSSPFSTTSAISNNYNGYHQQASLADYQFTESSYLVQPGGDVRPIPGGSQRFTNANDRYLEQFLQEKMNQIREFFVELPGKMGNWSAFWDSKQFSFPASMHEISQRLPDNIQAFFTNYSIICFLLLLYCFFTAPMLLFGLMGFSALLYAIIKRDQDLQLLDHSITRNQQMIALTLVSIPIFCILGLTSVFFWLIGASTCVVGLHSTFHESTKLQVDPSNGDQGTPAQFNLSSEPASAVLSV